MMKKVKHEMMDYIFSLQFIQLILHNIRRQRRHDFGTGRAAKVCAVSLRPTAGAMQMFCSLLWMLLRL